MLKIQNTEKVYKYVRKLQNFAEFRSKLPISRKVVHFSVRVAVAK